MNKALRTAASAAVVAGLLAGCATTSDASAPRTEMDRAIGQCVGTVLVGTLLGGVIGNNTGNGNAGRGAAVGASLGAAACGVLLAVASEKDRILAAQRAAVGAGGLQTASYQGSDGALRTVRTRTEDAPREVAGDNRICRYASTEIELAGKGTAPIGKQLYCRDEAGDWAIAMAGTASGAASQS